MLHLDGGETVVAKCLLIATGADYRRLTVEGCERFEGCGVYYAATPIEAQMCRGSDVVVVGGGNSAGQAAVFLAGQVRKVYLVIRGDDLYKNMSSYLARRIEQTAQHRGAPQHGGPADVGDGTSPRSRSSTTRRGRSETLQTPALFSFIGAVPRTDWLPPEIERDDKGVRPDGPGPGAVPPLDRASGSRSCWRPAAPACSPPATCGPARSSASPRPSARERWRSSSCTST